MVYCRKSNIRAEESYLIIAQGGTYSVAITDDLGCSVSSDPYQANYSGSEKALISASSNIQDVDVYPIPARDDLTLDMVVEEPSAVQIQIFDLRGSSQMTEQIDPESSSFSTKIDVSDYRRGIYLIKIKTGDETVTRRFIKL